MKKRIVLDFETRSACDLKKSGAFKYSQHPTTQPTCLAYKTSLMKIPRPGFLPLQEINRTWMDHGSDFRSWWRDLIRDGFLFTAHNAFFERCIYENILVARYGWPKIPIDQWRCTAAKAAACALPRSLEGAGKALNLTTQKDKTGYIAMMQTCMPTRAWKAWAKAKDQVKRGVTIRKRNYDLTKTNEPAMFLEPHHNPTVWANLYKYCKIDVLTEELLDDTLPDLIPQEQEIWHLNQEINWNGIRVDLPVIEKIVSMMAVESKVKLKELDTLTLGLVTKAGARKDILDFLALEGIELPDIKSKTVDDVLKEGKASPDARRLLELRRALSKTSTRKYESFLCRSSSDGRIRDLLLYHGASTGRDTGTGIQPQNFPRGTLNGDKNRPYAAIQNVIDCDLETLHLLYGDNLSFLFSHILRNVIIPSEGCELVVGDLSKIEVAVLWWLADNEPGLSILRAGKDPYKYQAAFNRRIKYEDVSDDGDDRQLGKAQVLGCGFGMGATKFQDAAWTMYRLKLSESQSKAAVKNYREANSAVPERWKEYEEAAVKAVQDTSSVVAGKCRFEKSGKFLTIGLPSGRKLRYLNPRVVWRETDYGPRRTLEFQGVAPSRKDVQWERTWGGTLTENIVQATARDILMFGLLNLKKAGYRILLQVHDEPITERKIGEGTVGEFRRIMCQRTPWADEKLPLDAKAWIGPRYRK